MDVFNEIITTMADLVKIAGGLVAVWGAVVLGSNMKDHNGPGITNGVWTIVGGAIIIAAATMFSGLI